MPTQRNPLFKCCVQHSNACNTWLSVKHVHSGALAVAHSIPLYICNAEILWWAQMRCNASHCSISTFTVTWIGTSNCLTCVASWIMCAFYLSISVEYLRCSDQNTPLQLLESLKFLHSIVTSSVKLSNEKDYINFAPQSTTRSYHSLNLTPYFARTNMFKFSFFPRSIEDWNSLPGCIRSRPSPNFVADIHDMRL